MGLIEQKLQELGIELPVAAAPKASYAPFIITGNMLYVSGQLPVLDGKIEVVGTLSSDLNIEQGQYAARLCAINILSQVKAALGGFERLERLVGLGGFVNAGADFHDHHLVINGASDFMVDVLGERGRHTRYAVGASGLPLNAAVEIEARFALKK